MITLFLKAHSELPIYLSIDVTSKNKIHEIGNEIRIPAVGSRWEVAFNDFVAKFSIGKVVARNEMICIYSDENERVEVTRDGQIIPWIESAGSYILVLENFSNT